MRRARVLGGLGVVAALVLGGGVAVTASAASVPVAVGSFVTGTNDTGATLAAEVTPAAAKKFKNCAALNKKYKGGVAKSKKAKNTKTVRGKKVRATSRFKPKVSAALYSANKHLDRDKDSIACER